MARGDEMGVGGKRTDTPAVVLTLSEAILALVVNVDDVNTGGGGLKGNEGGECEAHLDCRCWMWCFVTVLTDGRVDVGFT